MKKMSAQQIHARMELHALIKLTVTPVCASLDLWEIAVKQVRMFILHYVFEIPNILLF